MKEFPIIFWKIFKINLNNVEFSKQENFCKIFPIIKVSRVEIYSKLSVGFTYDGPNIPSQVSDRKL